MSEHIRDLKDEEQGKHSGSGKSNWIPGIILIALGVVFLLNNYMGIRLLSNWWALFILIPALINLNNAWTRYRADGRWSDEAIGALTGGVLIGAIALMFLLGISWSMFWPVMLIILGLGILLRRG